MADYLEQQLTSEIIGAAIEVHRALGPGLLESAYQACLEHELHMRGIVFESQMALPVCYKGLLVDCAYRIDVWIPNKILLELKSVSTLLPIHEAQLITYMKLLDCQLGLLINFNVPLLKNGLKRLIR
jgi:GxxExxY protein